MDITEDDLATCLRVLAASRALAPDDPRFLALENSAAHLRKHAKKKRKAGRRRVAKARDQALMRDTELGRARLGDDDAEVDADRRLNNQRACYVCKAPYREVHPRYHLLCVACGDASEARRRAPFDASGRRALVTGARVKIGYAVALRLLRSGAHVVATTRFPVDAARRYAAEPDFEAWCDRLEVHGLDFRRLPDVLRAIDVWRAGPPLDILINNAAQTVWHPPEYYSTLWAGESEAAALPVTRWTTPAQVPRLEAPVDAEVGLFGDPIDLRRTNSWVLDLEDVPPVEMVECQVVNSMVPFLLCSQLKPTLLRAARPDRYIVNVAALEGQFDRAHKLSRHPHTNMAKAALNMITRTSAEAYAADGIYLVSVDPGWMSHEGPHHIQAQARAAGFHPPLDAEDAAARILDPVIQGVAGAPVWGVLLKDFAPVPW